jgi:hypothetical protein
MDGDHLTKLNCNQLENQMKDKKVQITVSRKSAEIRREYLLRENKTTDLKHFTASLGVKVSSRVIPGGAKLLPKLPNQAMSINKTEFTREGSYSTGDGDVIQARRPGSDAHRQYKSFVSNGEAHYHHRGHQ